MTDLEELEASLAEARAKFLDSVQDLRPQLHKYCWRMTGSILDGEDLVQESLAQAYYKLSMMKQNVPLKPWLFKIAHNKCIDFLRRRKPEHALFDEEPDTAAVPASDQAQAREMVAAALSALVSLLPPKERASIILKDVLGYSLAESAEILDTSVGAVKAALHRGRGKLTAARPSRDHVPEPHADGEKQALLARYVDLFNQRDWDGVRQLLSADAQCDVIGVFSGVGRDAVQSAYMGRYAGRETPWRMAAADFDGETVICCLEQRDGDWRPTAVIRIDGESDQVRRIRDYTHVPYLLEGGLEPTLK